MLSKIQGLAEVLYLGSSILYLWFVRPVSLPDSYCVLRVLVIVLLPYREMDFC